MLLSRIHQNEYFPFLVGLNAAFKARENSHIPYEEMTIESLTRELSEKNNYAYGAYAKGVLVGGIVVSYKSVDTVHLKHLWVNPKYQNQGCATFIFSELENQLLKARVKFVTLSVADCYIKAVKLYKRQGYKTYAVTANTPGTFFFLEMIKGIEPYKYPEYKRLLKLAISRLKFKLLFDKYSSPKKLHTLIYGRNQ